MNALPMHAQPLVLVAALNLISTLAAAQTRLSTTEAKVAKDVRQNWQREGLPLLERTVNINSGSGNPKGVRAVGEVYARELSRIGFEISWIDLARVERGPHLFARHRGARDRRVVLLIGHLDTVFEQTHSFQRFERLNEHRARGPGVYDMKGGNVAIIQALRGLHRAGALRELNVHVAFTGDEERPGRDAAGGFATTRGPLLALARESDVALGFEPGMGDGLDSVTIARRGTTGWRLEVSARSAHSSQVFRREIGPGAIYPAAMAVGEFYRKLHGRRYLTFNAALAAGGERVQVQPNRLVAAGKSNIVPATARIEGDLRTIDARQLTRTKRQMERIVATTQRRLRRRYRSADGEPLVTLALTFRAGYPPMPPTSGNRALLRRLSEVSVAVGGKRLRALDPGRRGAADISFVAGAVKGALGGLGPIGSGAHTPRETIDLRSLPVVTQRAALIVYRLGRESRSDPL